MQTAICVAKSTKAGVIIYGQNKTTVRTHKTLSEDWGPKRFVNRTRSRENTINFVQALLQTPEVRELAQFVKQCK